MQINRYSSAQEAPIINTYVPINFGELYKIGAAQKQAVDEATQQFTGQLQKFGEFTSVSDEDVRDYRASTIGVLQNLIDEAVRNPDNMKDAAFIARIQQGINSIDYNHLARLRKSAENMDVRQKAVAALRAQDLYEDWFDDPQYTDLKNWSTRKQGIMSNLSPNKYMSMEELGREYVKDLKPTFYKGKAPNSGTSMPYTNWLAISRSDIRRSLNDQADDILSTTAGKRHFERFANMYQTINPQATGAEIRESFIDALTTEQSDKMIETPVIDTASLNLELANIAANKNKKTGEDALALLYPSDLNTTYRTALNRKAEMAKNMNPELDAKIKLDNEADVQKLRNVYADFVNNPNTASLMNAQLNILKEKGVINDNDIASNDISLDVIQTLMSNAVRALDKKDPLYSKYQAVLNEVYQTTRLHNEKISSELAKSTLRAYLSLNREEDKKETENPFQELFTNVSSSGQQGIDQAVSATMGDLQLNQPDQQLIIDAVFGRDQKTNLPMTQTKDFYSARSPFDYLIENYDSLKQLAKEGAKAANYNKTNEKGNQTLIGATDPGLLSLENRDYSIRNKAAAGDYGNLEIVELRDYTPVEGTDPNEYAFYVTVRLPLDILNKNTDWWADYGLDDIRTQEGLKGGIERIKVLNDEGKETLKDAEYVDVPMVINKSVPPTTKFRLDAYYRKQIHASTELNKANEQQTAAQYPQASYWYNLNNQQ